MMKKTWPFYISLLLLILVGCQNGCTTASTMDRESAVMKRNGEKILIVAKLMDFRNSRRKYSNRIFPRQISHSYGIEFEVSGLGLKNLHFYSEDVDDPDNVDLDKYLKNVKVSLSKDKYHLAVGYKDELIKVFHLFKGKEINSMYIDDSGSTSWKSLNINGYPTPKELILEELNENCNFSIFLEENVKDLFEDLKPSDSAHVILLNHWPDCRIAKEYYQGARLNELSRNKIWRSYAVDRAEGVFSNSFYSYNFSEEIKFYEALNSPKLNKQIESYIVDNWNTNSDGRLTEYIINDMRKSGNKISFSNKEIIYNDAKTTLNQFLSKGKISFTDYSDKCMAVVIAFGDTSVSYQILEEGILSKRSKLDAETSVEILYSNESSLTPYQRKILNDNIETFFKNLSPRDKSDVFREMNNFKKCRLLRKWKNEYPDELEFNFISMDC